MENPAYADSNGGVNDVNGAALTGDTDAAGVKWAVPPSETETPALAPSSGLTLLKQPRERLGDIIVALGFCERELVENASETAASTEQQIGQILIERGLLNTDQLASALARRFGIQHLTLDDIALSSEIANLVTYTSARRMRAIPVALDDDGVLLVAVTNPQNYLIFEDIAMYTGKQIRPVVVSDEDMETLLRRLSIMNGELGEDLFAEETATNIATDGVDMESPDDAPTIKLVRSVISDAVDRGASDIHFAPEEGGLNVRYRIDGVMTPAARVPRSQALAVISRIKILSDLDISEKRVPQDGRIGIVIDGRRIDIRVAVVPLVDGESAVLRILDAGRTPLSLNDLGMSAADLERIAAPLRATHGAILATGPTGSGKTTSLYAVIALISSPDKTLTTIEDPVEYRLPGVNQIQVSERAGLTFATGLKAIVRADPDVIMVGEIRDRESAHMAVDAALTGHLVLSTLHTNDAPSAAMRLVDMGIEPYLVASAVNCVIAQRLARRLCTSCRKPTTVPGVDVGLSNELSVEVYEAAGCGRCRHTGYSGRLALFEVMVLTDELRSLIVKHASAHEIAELAIAQGMRTLQEDAHAKVREGATTLAEIGRVLG
jgi:type IV pilus assembly protein PilB